MDSMKTIPTLVSAVLLSALLYFTTNLTAQPFSASDPLGIRVDDVAAMNAMPEQVNLRRGWLDVTKPPFNAVHAPLHALDADKQANDEIAAMDRRTYAGMMTAMDRNIGRVLDAIAAAGLEKNTIVAFLSDNGGPAPDAEEHSRTAASNGPLRGYKIDVWEGGIRTPMVMKWPGHIPAGKTLRGTEQFDGFGRDVSRSRRRFVRACEQTARRGEPSAVPYRRKDRRSS